MLPTLYGLTNLSSVVLIVFANKIVLGSYRFHFPVMLTWLHTIATAAGMVASAALGMFPTKQVPLAKSLPMSAVYVAFIVFNNLSIRHNPVGFYQISKIAITPVVVAIEFFAYGRKASARVRWDPSRSVLPGQCSTAHVAEGENPPSHGYGGALRCQLWVSALAVASAPVLQRQAVPPVPIQWVVSECKCCVWFTAAGLSH
jgi:hypothetical protein